MRLPGSLAAAAMAAVPGAAVAADAVMLPAVEVSAPRPVLESEPPALKTEITAEKLESINAPNVEDSLRYEPNLIIRKRFIGDRNATLSFRDMHTTQTARALVMGDGLLLSNFLGSSFGFAPRWGVIQPEEVERIEVIYGPYAAEYGGNSLGGAVVLHTRMPERFEAHIGANAMQQEFEAYGTDETLAGYKLHGSLGERHDRWSYFLAVDRLENEGHPQTFGITGASGGAPTGNTVTGAYDYPGERYLYNSPGSSEITQDLLKFKLGYDLTNDLQARLTVAYLDRSDDILSPETYLRDADGNPVYNGTVDIDGQSYTVRSQRMSMREAQDLIYGAELEGRLGKGWEIKSALSFYDTLDDATRSSGTDYAQALANGAGTLTEDQGSGWQAFDLKLGHRHDAGWLGQRLLFGYHFNRYQLDEASFDTAHWRDADVTALTGDSEGKTRVHALFLENEWQLSQRWTAVLGGRQEWWKAYDGSLASSSHQRDYPERSESRFSPKASLSFQPNRDWLASLSLGIAYRFPTVGELYQGSLDNAGNFTASFDPNLKDEKGFAKNLLVTRYLEYGTVSISLWENDVDDAIFRQTDVFTGVTSYQNIDRVRSRGIELISQWQDFLIDGLDLDANLSYTRAKILDNAAVPESEGKQFPRVPEWRGNLLASYRVSRDLKVAGGVRYASDPYDTLANSDGSLRGFGYTDRFLVFDTRVTYRLGRGLTLAAGIDNITDRRYYVYHPYPGRTFHAELKWAY